MNTYSFSGVLAALTLTAALLFPTISQAATFRTEGDSYMLRGATRPDNEKLALRLIDLLAPLNTVINTAKPSSSPFLIRDRMTAPANAGLLPHTAIIWDGFSGALTSNGGTAAGYVDILDTGITALGHDRFLVVATAVTPSASGPTKTNAENILTEMVSRWGSERVLDWRPLLDTTNNDRIDAAFMAPDDVHLNSTGVNIIADAIVDNLKSRNLAMVPEIDATAGMGSLAALGAMLAFARTRRRDTV